MDKQLLISYDKEADVMYLNFGQPVKAYGEEIDEGIFARYDPVTHDLVGVTIVNFAHKFGTQPKAVGVPVRI